MRIEILIIRKIDKEIIEQSKEKGLNPVDLVTPTATNWLRTPFETKIKIGYPGFNGMPNNREYYRILTHKDSRTQKERRFWIRAVKKWKFKKIEYEWKEEKTVANIRFHE